MLAQQQQQQQNSETTHQEDQLQKKLDHQKWQLGQQQHHESEQRVLNMQLLQQKQNEHLHLQQQIAELNAQLALASTQSPPILHVPPPPRSSSSSLLMAMTPSAAAQTKQPAVNINALAALLKIDTRCSSKRDGIYRDELDCSSFYICETAETMHRIHKFTCPAGLVFSMYDCTCDWPKPELPCISPLLSSFCKETGPDNLAKLGGGEDKEAQTLSSIYLLNQILASIPFSCKSKEIGLHRDALDCSKFYFCQRLGSNIELVKNDFYCPDGLYFNAITCQCDWPANTACVSNNLNGGMLISSAYCVGSKDF